MEKKITFFKDLDIDAVREAQKEYNQLKHESETAKLNLDKSESMRSKLNVELRAKQKHIDLLT